MRGTKAKRLRREGKRSGPAERSVDEAGQKKIETKIAAAKLPYNDRKTVRRHFDGFADHVRERIIQRRKNGD